MSTHIKKEAEQPPIQTDKITLERIALLHPLIRKEVEQLYYEACAAIGSRNIRVRFTRTLSTFAEQDKLFAQGRTTKGKIVTWVRGGFSFHNYGLAFDVCFVRDNNGDGKFDEANFENNVDWDGDGKADWAEFDAIARKYGFAGLYKKDGKRFDLPHFQKTFGYTTQELLKLYNEGKVDEHNYVKIQPK